MLPKLIRKIAVPSIFQTNFSLRIIGANTALKMIVKHDVEEIKMMLPNPKAIPLKTCPRTSENTPA